MSDRRDLHINCHEHIYYVWCTSHSGNHIALTLCSHCLGILKTNGTYAKFETMAHISKLIVCSRCLAFHPRLLGSLYNVTEAEIKAAIDNEKGIDIAENGLTLFIHSFSPIIKPE